MKKSFKLFVSLIVLGMLAGCSNNESQGSASGTNRLDEIVERGYIEVATEPYFAPNEFIDPSKEGQDQYVGSDMEMAQYIADDLGVDLRIVPLEFGAVLSGVSEGKYDLAISALAYTPAREESITLSKGYYFSEKNDQTDGHGLLIRQDDIDSIKSPEDLADKTIVYQSGSLQELFANEQVPKTKEVKRVSATTDGFLMVEENKADACITSVGTASLYMDANPDANLAIVEDFRFEEYEEYAGIRIGIPKNEPELTQRINDIIDELVESGQYNQWYDEYQEYARSLGL